MGCPQSHVRRSARPRDVPGSLAGREPRPLRAEEQRQGGSCEGIGDGELQAGLGPRQFRRGGDCDGH